MKKHKILTMLLVLVIITNNVISATAATHTLNITPFRQEKSNWCWAATTRMIIDYLDTWSPLPSQTNIVTTVKGSNVNEAATYSEMTDALESFSVSTTFRNGALNFSYVKEMLYGWYSPIETSIGYSNGNGHSQIIYGYEENGTDKGLYILDPRMSGTQYLYYEFEEYQENSSFWWRYTWYNNQQAS